MITLCGAHHRAAHRGAISISGTPSTGLVARHGCDGSLWLPGTTTHQHLRTARQNARRRAVS
jgi:hypothetical protein